jgi:hypothetical protein
VSAWRPLGYPSARVVRAVGCLLTFARATSPQPAIFISTTTSHSARLHTLDQPTTGTASAGAITDLVEHNRGMAGQRLGWIGRVNHPFGACRLRIRASTVSVVSNWDNPPEFGEDGAHPEVRTRPVFLEETYFPQRISAKPKDHSPIGLLYSAGHGEAPDYLAGRIWAETNLGSDAASYIEIPGSNATWYVRTLATSESLGLHYLRHMRAGGDS